MARRPQPAPEPAPTDDPEQELAAWLAARGQQRLMPAIKDAMATAQIADSAIVPMLEGMSERDLVVFFAPPEPDPGDAPQPEPEPEPEPAKRARRGTVFHGAAPLVRQESDWVNRRKQRIAQRRWLAWLPPLDAAAGCGLGVLALDLLLKLRMTSFRLGAMFAGRATASPEHFKATSLAQLNHSEYAPGMALLMLFIHFSNRRTEPEGRLTGLGRASCWGALASCVLFVVGVVAQGGAKVGHPLRIAGAAGRYVCYAGLLLEAGRCAARRLASEAAAPSG